MTSMNQSGREPVTAQKAAMLKIVAVGLTVVACAPSVPEPVETEATAATSTYLIPATATLERVGELLHDPMADSMDHSMDHQMAAPKAHPTAQSMERNSTAVRMALVIVQVSVQESSSNSRIVRLLRRGRRPGSSGRREKPSFMGCWTAESLCAAAILT